jgi:molybdate transport system substrate-binding protein
MNFRMLVAVATLCVSGIVSAAEIRLLAAGATEEICSELIPAFELATGHKVVGSWTGTVDIKKKIAAGEVFDALIVGASEVDTFIAQGKVVSGSRVDLMKSGVGVAVRAGTLKPDIRSADALRKTLIDAKSIAYSTGPSGVYVAKMLERMGIAEQVKFKIITTKTGVRVGTLIARGEAEIGFQQVSELIHDSGIEYVGPLPGDLQSITVYSAGIHSLGGEPDAAKALVHFLAAPAAGVIIRKNGMDPA